MSSPDTTHARVIEDRYTLETYPKLDFALVRGEGSYVEDDAGNRYLDLYGGHAVTTLGHSHPAWVEAISRQAAAMDFYSNICYHPLRAEAARIVVENSYPSMKGAYFCNSGAEANETALKIARKHTGRRRVVSMADGFHGRTLGSLGATGLAKYRDPNYPLPAEHAFVPYGDAAALRKEITRDVAAVILEPIQSLAGVRMAPPEYYRRLREHCSAHGIVLIFDEVQTGNGRTGRWFIGRHWEVEPDIVTTAKGIAGGYPVGAVLASARVASGVKSGDQGSTFGGGPLAAAAIVATYRTLLDEGIVERVAAKSAKVIAALRERIGKGLVRDVRGLGYLLGIECELPAKEVQSRLRKKGILVGTSNHADTFRLLPPLTVSDAEWESFFEALDAVPA